MTQANDAAEDSAEARLAQLIDRLLASMDDAAGTGSWPRVMALADDVLAVDPGNTRAAALVERARLEQSLPEGERAFVSLLFADIVQSTDLADVSEPETMRHVFRLYREVATAVIGELEGRVLQFQGDGVVACFGYPRVHEDDARRAVLAGLRLIDGMADAGHELRRHYQIEPAIRVGIHSGTVVVTGLASGSVDAADIVGSAANIAARLQAEAEPGTLVISDATRQLVEPHFVIEPAGERILRGIARPMGTFRVVAPTVAGAPGPRLTDSVPLVGRKDEIRVLRQTWERAVASCADRQVPTELAGVIRGPAGIGKSRMAAELCEEVRAEGGAVREAHCSPYHANVALWPIGRMLEQLLDLYPEQSPDERLAVIERRLEDVGLDKAETLPHIAPLLGLDLAGHWSTPHVDALALRTETLRTLVAWLGQVARTTPCLILIEDLHWADPTTVDLLGLMIAERIPGVMILVTSRSSPEADWATRCLDIALEPLNGQEAGEFVDQVAQESDLAPDLRRAITERGGGVPLFLQELARSALTATPGEVLPPRLHELLTARLRSPGIDLRVAQLAATLGPEFESAQLCRIAEVPVDDVLVQLERADIIEPVGEARRGVYRFRHGLLRDAAYETQVLDSRRSNHSRIAELLSATAATPGDLAIAAQHHDLAGDTAQAIPAYVAAAQAAQSAASHIEARRLLDRGLELLHLLPASDERDLTDLMIRMLRTVSVSSLFGYGYAGVYDDFRVADDICRRLTSRAEIMPAQVGVWSYLLVRGDVEAAGVVLEPLATQLDAPETAWFAPEIRSCLGYSEFYRGRLDDARQWFEEAWAGYLARPSDATASPFWPLPHDPVPVTAVALACIAGLQGRTAESALWEQRALDAAEQLDFPFGPFSSAFISTYLAWLRMLTGDPAGARQFGQRTMDIAATCRFDYFSVIGRQYTLVPDTDLPSDPAELLQCEVGMDLVGHVAFRPAFLGIVARNHAYAGDLDQALARLDDAFVGVDVSGERIHLPELLRLRAELTAAAHPDRTDAAVADLQSAIEVALSQGSVLLALRAANQLARLDPGIRPTDWCDVLRSVLDAFPPDSASPELVDARSILGD